MSDSEEDIFKTASDSDEDEDDEQDEASVNEKEDVADADVDESVVPDEDEDEDEDPSVVLDEDADTVADSDEEQPVQNKKIQTKVPQKNVGGDDDDDSDEEDEDETYLQKFDTQIRGNYVNTFHPECITHNYQEISALTKVVRDKSNIIIDPLHRTLPFLTKYEYTRVVGQRAKQINSGAKPFIKIPENVIDGAIIAEMELAQKRIPFIIRRPFPGGGCEYWNLKDLEMIK
jgi:DNA-directed RNA polymerase subunit K/omega